MLYGLDRSRAACYAFVFGTTLSTAAAAFAATPSLPAYNAAINETSISGISSGAYMAVQFGTAWSSIIKGVGAIAGGPFGCSEGSGSAALSTCMGGLPAIDLQELIKRTNAWSAAGKIDSTRLLEHQKVYLFNGYNDSVVARPVSNALYAFYAHYLPSATGNIFYQTAVGAGHSQVTLAYGGKCSESSGEFINKCDYDQAGVILQHIYGALSLRNDGALTGQFRSFRQADFTTPDQPVDDSMGDTGFAYVPSSCGAGAPCRLHVALHGCLQSFSTIGQDFVKHAGYNEWADANNIIVLYPQTQALGFTNPQSCWDWWGYLDKDPTETPTYLLKSGKQIRAIKAMIDHVTSGAASAPQPASPAPLAPVVILSPDRSDTAIEIVWSPAAGATSYEVFRADPANDNFQKVATIGGLSYADTNLRPATKYRYEVRVSSKTGSAAFSPIVVQTTLRRVQPCVDPGTCLTH